MGAQDYMVKPGLGYVPAFQTSGMPYLSGGYVDATAANNGEVCIDFPSVCRSFTVTNLSSIPLLVHFDTRANAAVIGHHHYALVKSEGSAWTFSVKATRVYVSTQPAVGLGEFTIAAELTCVDRRELSSLSGSGIND